MFEIFKNLMVSLARKKFPNSYGTLFSVTLFAKANIECYLEATESSKTLQTLTYKRIN
jgi:hypothetical protein